MPTPLRFDHVGITVADLDRAVAFFESIGLEIEGRASMAGDFVDTVTGIPDVRCEMVMLRPPGDGPGVELSAFTHPEHQPGNPAALSTELGLRNIAFQIEDVRATVARLDADGYHLVGGIGQYEDVWLMAYVRGPDGIIVAQAERLD